jgi:hypothetical protein
VTLQRGPLQSPMIAFLTRPAADGAMPGGRNPPLGPLVWGWLGMSPLHPMGLRGVRRLIRAHEIIGQLIERFTHLSRRVRIPGNNQRPVVMPVCPWTPAPECLASMAISLWGMSMPWLGGLDDCVHDGRTAASFWEYLSRQPAGRNLPLPEHHWRAGARLRVERARYKENVRYVSDDHLFAPYKKRKHDNRSALCQVLTREYDIVLSLEDSCSKDHDEHGDT